MKTILVLTDFSPAAEHATAYAAQLAKVVQASVRLLHVYQLPVAMSDMPVLMVSAEDLKKSADAGLRRAKEAAERLHPETVFEMESRLGDVVEEAEDVSKQKDVFALVAGTKSMSGVERFLFGSTAQALVKKCSHPVIVVPENAELNAPKNIALAVDFVNPGEVPAAKILAAIQALRASLQVVHVETENEQAGDPSSLLNALHLAPSAYRILKEENVAQGLKHFAELNKIDLVTVLPHKHNLLERLFFKGYTNEILHELSVPVMTLHGSSE
ncbi:universal stress protein [Flavisolibacter ginsenosidimutans]|nr:universal stress protein [Flavisolibacter ginsenosidimutans]